MDESHSRRNSLDVSTGTPRRSRSDAPGRPLMQISLDREAIRELVQEVLTEIGGVMDWPAGRVALDEAEAARACGVARHVLRDLRLSGQIKARKLGRKVVYTREDLMRALGGIHSEPQEDVGRNGSRIPRHGQAADRRNDA